MPTYKVKPGRTFGKNREYKAGDTVELTEKEAAGFADKLQLVTEEGTQMAGPPPSVKPDLHLTGLSEKLLDKLANGGFWTAEQVSHAGDDELKEKVKLTDAQLGVVRERTNAYLTQH